MICLILDRTRWYVIYVVGCESSKFVRITYLMLYLVTCNVMNASRKNPFERVITTIYSELFFNRYKLVLLLVIRRQKNLKKTTFFFVYSVLFWAVFFIRLKLFYLQSLFSTIFLFLLDVFFSYKQHSQYQKKLFTMLWFYFPCLMIMYLSVISQ